MLSVRSIRAFALVVPALLLVAATPAQANPNVTFYEDANYRGRSMSVGEGNYDTYQLRAVGDNNISSVTVPHGWRVVLYDEPHFKGRSITLDSDTTFLSSFNDLTSSIRVSRLPVGPPTVAARRGRKCADENGWCTFRGEAEVYYGTRDKWVVQRHANRVGCNNGVFGDPWPGVRKECYVDEPPPPPAGPPTVTYKRGRKCADEGSWCTFRGSAEVYYGAGNKWVVRRHAGRVICNNSVFGDPTPGVRKACFVDER